MLNGLITVDNIQFFAKLCVAISLCLIVFRVCFSDLGLVTLWVEAWKAKKMLKEFKELYGEISEPSQQYIGGYEGKYTTLKNSDIPNLPDDELVYGINCWMWGKFSSDFLNQYEVISSFPKTCQNICSALFVEDFVNNVGFYIKPNISDYKIAYMAEEGFRAIGAVGFASIVAKANAIYKEMEKDLLKYTDTPPDENHPLDKLDAEFKNMYKSEQLEKLYITYIRKNAEYFGD